jgi:uncharacterized membrane protein
MVDYVKPPSHISQTWLRRLLVLVLVIGIGLRFYNLDQKLYSRDEVQASFTIAGYQDSVVAPQLCTGRLLSIQDLSPYQTLKPESQVSDTLQALVANSPQSSPLYFTLSRLWMERVGSSIVQMRLLSAIISVAIFPVAYWLCWELFQEPMVGWMVMALMAVSPVQLLYAQTVQEHSLWNVIILLSSATLLWAVRVRHPICWGVYAMAMIAGLYTSALHLLVVLSHGAYMLLMQTLIRPGKSHKALWFYGLVTVASLTAFSPLGVMILTKSQQIHQLTYWTAEHHSLSYWIKSWIVNLGHWFIDFNYRWEIGHRGSPLKAIIRYASPLIVAFVGYALYFLYRQTTARTWLFISLLIGLPAAALVLPDLVWGSERSRIVDYLLPCYLGIQLSVAYLLTGQIFAPWGRVLAQARIWQGVTALVLVAGIASCGLSSQAVTWWHQPTHAHTEQVIRKINAAERPLLINFCEKYQPLANTLVFSHQLDPKVTLQLVPEKLLPQIPSGFSEIFLFNPPQTVQDRLASNSQVEFEPVSPHKLQLWTLSQKFPPHPAQPPYL